MKTSLIVARGIDNVIGLDNRLPWNCSEELKHFKKLTTGKIIVMGRNTWESLPIKPLPNRINIVITSDINKVKGADTVVNSVERAIEAATLFKKHSDEVMFIGGESIYKQVVDIVDEAHVSEVNYVLDDVTNNISRFDYHFDYNVFELIKTKTSYDGNYKKLFDYYHWVRKITKG